MFVPSKTGVSVSPSSVEVLQSNPTGLQGRIPWGFSVPLSDPQAGKPDVEFRTFTTMGELVWYYCYSPVCGSPIWWVQDLTLSLSSPSYHLVAAPSLYLDVWYLFMVGSSVLLSMADQQIVAVLVLLQEEMSTYLSTLPS